ncbi:hypothetical protein Pint_26972 [Pistacia integerrima]|uniref:Uncharacterized protein n=1 Tax=Pistacia integerrima TaxID=434235 RepID=A0ACC0YM14_9ROSI|nr:hypothetical protein Pint_26972 [Pistacia integerrima]
MQANKKPPQLKACLEVWKYLRNRILLALISLLHQLAIVVPFRTSPATPQPVAFSSGSSLPTSSPPHFSNGSTELQHQVPYVIEETTPYGESSCVLFSARKVPLFLSDSLQRHPYSS